MENGIFAYILKYSKRQQLILTSMTIASFPFYYLSLDLPKTIINDAISGDAFPVDAKITLFNLTIHFGTFEQIPYLILLCLAFFLLVLANSSFKLIINIYRGTLGERMLRRLRFQLIERIMQFPLNRFRRTSQGELVSMVNQETEPLGGFFGEAISLPLYQGGLLLTILVFMFVQDWKLGLAAIALYPVQGWLIPKLQRQINLLNQQRTIRLRNLAENLGEVVAGINEIHVNDNSSYIKDQFSKLLGGIFNVRVKIYRKKFLIKFLNNSFAQFTPFLFFLIGGLLVIRGELSVGALVAALAAYKDLSPPWKELLSWYQGQADARLRYCVLTEQFQIDETEARGTKNSVATQPERTLQSVPVSADSISLQRTDGTVEVDTFSLKLEQGEWVSLVGNGNSGKNSIAQMFARLASPSKGRILIADHDLAKASYELSGRAIAYSGHDSYLFAGTIRDNLLMSLKHKPQDRTQNIEIDETIEFKNWREEARISGNSDLDLNTDWVDYEGAGVASEDQLTEQIMQVLQTVEVADDLLRNALERSIVPEEHPDLAKQIVIAREMFNEQVIEQKLEPLVEFLDPEQFNENTTLAENILFGSSSHEEFSPEGLTEHPVLQQLLKKNQLTEVLDASAISTATTMIELFSDLPPGHDFFGRYSFLDAHDLTKLTRALGLLNNSSAIDNLNAEDRTLLRSIPFRLIGGRHRVGVLTDTQKNAIVSIRKSFAENLDKASRDKINFFSQTHYNASTSIIENIIFGRIVYGRLGAEDNVYRIVLDVLHRLNLVPLILRIGLAAPTGLAGSLLNVPQRQKLAMARGLMKKPGVLIVNDGLNSIDHNEVETILTNIKQNYPDLSVLWSDNQARFPDLFDSYAYLDAGKMTKLEESVSNYSNDQSSLPAKKGNTIRSLSSIDENEKIALLNSSKLFGLLDASHLGQLASNCDLLKISNGEILFNQGDPGDALYIIIDGRAGIFKLVNGQEQMVGSHGVNEVIGEVALLSNNPRLASVKALSDLALLRLKRDVFVETLRTNGEIGYQILQVVIERFVRND